MLNAEGDLQRERRHCLHQHRADSEVQAELRVALFDERV
jgi:hypothetical protein